MMLFITDSCLAVLGDVRRGSKSQPPYHIAHASISFPFVFHSEIQSVFLFPRDKVFSACIVKLAPKKKAFPFLSLSLGDVCETQFRTDSKLERHSFFRPFYFGFSGLLLGFTCPNHNSCLNPLARLLSPCIRAKRLMHLKCLRKQPCPVQLKPSTRRGTNKSFNATFPY